MQARLFTREMDIKVKQTIKQYLRCDDGNKKIFVDAIKDSCFDFIMLVYDNVRVQTRGAMIQSCVQGQV